MSPLRTFPMLLGVQVKQGGQHAFERRRGQGLEELRNLRGIHHALDADHVPEITDQAEQVGLPAQVAIAMEIR
ncbi:MAG: hypothetical protein ACRDHK_01630, partial [Actinomycetota bacterium]